jgi:hypothetical protein
LDRRKREFKKDPASCRFCPPAKPHHVQAASTSNLRTINIQDENNRKKSVEKTMKFFGPAGLGNSAAPRGYERLGALQKFVRIVFLLIVNQNQVLTNLQ